MPNIGQGMMFSGPAAGSTGRLACLTVFCCAVPAGGGGQQGGYPNQNYPGGEPNNHPKPWISAACNLDGGYSVHSCPYADHESIKPLMCICHDIMTSSASSVQDSKCCHSEEWSVLNPPALVVC